MFLPRKLPGPRSEGGYNKFQELIKVFHSWIVEWEGRGGRRREKPEIKVEVRSCQCQGARALP